ncbi:MAG: cytochrome c [Verrucomicrobia bacterium]|nr:cytochrome c [Verrucomicrobiota bacterium]
MTTDPTKLIPSESPEPTTQTKAPLGVTQLLVIVLLGFMVYWASGYIDDNGGRFDPIVYEPYGSTNDLAAFFATDDGAAARGKTVFKTFCAPCHMESGLGDSTRFIPPLAGSEWVNTDGPNRIVRIVLNGLQGPITVKGQSYGGAAMLPWRDVLNDQDIAAVLTYVRSEWGNKGAPVTPEDAKKVREATAARSENWTADELLKVPDKD